MNIFFLSDDPFHSAQDQCDKHVNKMISESCQLLCAAFHTFSFDDKSLIPWKLAYQNHICSVWVRTSKYNFEWLLYHLEALLQEYDLRFQKPECHAKARQTLAFCKTHYSNLAFPLTFLTIPPLAFGNKNDPKLDMFFQQLKEKWGIYDKKFGVNGAYFPKNFTNLIDAYREYYCYKTFKNQVPLEWKHLPSRQPSWYSHKSL